MKIALVGVLAFGAGVLSQAAPGFFEPALIEDARLKAIAKTHCQGHSWNEQDDHFTVLWFRPRWAGVFVNSVEACVADFEVDSGFAGSVAAAVSTKSVREYRFFNRFDTELRKRTSPSFVLRAYWLDGAWWGFDTLDGGLGRVKDGELTYLEPPSR